jgi:hypothetical protein
MHPCQAVFRKVGQTILSINDRTDKMCNRTVFREPTLRIAQDKQGAPLHICLSLPTGDHTSPAKAGSVPRQGSPLRGTIPLFVGENSVRNTEILNYCGLVIISLNIIPL